MIEYSEQYRRALLTRLYQICDQLIEKGTKT
jgi:hypothetical protein